MMTWLWSCDIVVPYDLSLKALACLLEVDDGVAFVTFVCV